MNPGGRTLNQRSMKCTAAIALALFATGAAFGATFTPGNVIVASASSSTGPQQIVIAEYTSAGSLVQSFNVPNVGPAPFGLTNGGSTTQFQINFSDDSNQILYIACSFTNVTVTPRVVGYLRVNASSGTIVLDEANAVSPSIDNDARGFAWLNCRGVLGAAASGARRFTTGGAWELFFSGNLRYVNGFGNDIYVSTGGTTSPLTSNGIWKVPVTDAAPATPTLVALTGATGTNPLGFFVADANTIYVGRGVGGADALIGVQKFIGGVSEGVPTATTQPVADIDGTVDGGGNVKLYFVTASNLFTLDDTLGSSGGTWTGTAITQLPPTFSGRVRSVAVVPAAITPPSYSVNTATAGGGFGSVAKSPATGPYVKCSTVTLTATANPGSIFVNWTGDVPNPPNATNPLPLLVDGNKNVTANFNLLAGNNVLNLTGVGSGTINATPPGSNFASPGGPYPIVQPTNTSITLTATPASGWIFDHWSGDVNPGDEFFDTISINLNANKNVTCTFKELFRVRNFATGNGTNSITGPTPDGTGLDGFPLYRSGTQVSFSSTAGNIGTPANTWTFTEYQDAALTTLSTNPIFTTAPLTGPLDVTAVFVETPNTNTPQAFGARDIVLGTIRDFSSPGVIQLREYNSAGQLVQPVITVPSTGTPSAVTDLPTGTTSFDINFDAANDSRLYVAGQGINAALPNQVGFIRTQFSAGSFVFDLAKGNQATTSNGRGVTANGNDVYYSYDAAIKRYDIAGDAVSTVNSGNTRMVEMFNSALYCSTSSAGGPYAGGPGIFRIDDPNGTPATNLVFQVPTITANAPNLLSFKFANANNCYVGLQAGNGYGGLLKFYYDGSTWINRNTPLALGTDWGRGVDVVVSGNNVRIYIQNTFATSEGRLSYIDDTLDNTSDWENLPITTIVPLVSRGRSLAVVPGNPVPVCTTCLGDVVQDSKVNGVDIQGFVKCLLGVGGTNCQCGDYDSSGTVTTADIPPFITSLRTSTSCP